MTYSLRFAESVALLSYNLLLWLMCLPIVVFTASQAVRRGGSRYFLQRLGLMGFMGFMRLSHAPAPVRPIWLHAASVGEVLAALPLIESMRTRFADIPIVLTTVTPTGAAVAAARLPTVVTHIYLPLDWRAAVARFLRAVQPRCALIMETELWPNLYAACAARKLPLVIINGRISARTLRAGRWMRVVYRATLNHVDAVLARSDSDRAAFISLGARAEQVRVLGNIKFAAPATTPTPIRLLDRPYVLAASTHADEELLLARVWQGLQRKNNLLVIVPRHPQRGALILRQLDALHLNIAVRSRGDVVNLHTDMYLADTLGELPAFIHGAELVFVGGSLVPVGGHNVLEPARAGKAIVFGPHMHNFAEESALLLAQHAALQVRDATELAAAFATLLAAPEQARALGVRAQSALVGYADIVEKYLAAITPYCSAIH